MFKKGIKKDFLLKIKKPRKDNIKYIKGLNIITIIYETKDFRLVYNGGDKMLVKARLGNFSWITKPRKFMLDKFEEIKHLKE